MFLPELPKQLDNVNNRVIDDLKLKVGSIN